jgi:penicillin V acylase-like amidase (Ntn superfamily)
MPSYRDNSEVGRPAVWTSKFGSVTFNQYGREMPFGGMNEAGLVIGTMGLFKKNKFPTPDSRPSIFVQHSLQYQLDNHDSVDEVVHSESQLRIRPKTVDFSALRRRRYWMSIQIYQEMSRINLLPIHGS